MHIQTHPVAASLLKKSSHSRYPLFHILIRILGSVGRDFLAHPKVFRYFHNLRARLKDRGFVHIFHVHSDGGCGGGENDLKRGYVHHSHVQNILLLGLVIQALRSRKERSLKMRFMFMFLKKKKKITSLTVAVG